MGVPGAYICHQSPHRLRIKIASRKGNATYFEKLQATLIRFQAFDRLEVNSLTGSVLIVDDYIDVDDIADFAKTRHLFDLMNQSTSRSPMTTQLVSHLENLDTSVHRITSGELDLAGILLLGLLISGLTGLLRSDVRMPPWYTAFWYAFGIYKVASVVKENKTQDA
jgi:hypothetical protein